MSCMYKIEASEPLFSKTEKKIAKFILKNKKEVLKCTAQTLADQIPTSAAAIIRFSKKLGYSGFSALKLDLASDPNIDEPLNLMDMIQKDDSFSTLLKKTKLSNQNTLDQTYSSMNESAILEVVELMKKATRIFLIGDGASGVVCQDFEQKLLRLGYSVFFHSDVHVRLSAINRITKEDVLIAISYSGQTKDIVKSVEHAKGQGCTVVAISSLGRSPLQKQSNILLSIPKDEGELRFGAISSRMASLIYTDVLYLKLAQDDLDETKEKLVETKSLVKKIL